MPRHSLVGSILIAFEDRDLVGVDHRTSMIQANRGKTRVQICQGEGGDLPARLLQLLQLLLTHGATPRVQVLLEPGSKVALGGTILALVPPSELPLSEL